ncbi:MAG: hypothetical protein ACPGU1_22575, partial [Myxococcota bacterium]
DNDCDGTTDEDFGDGGSVTATDVDGSGSLHLAQACGGIGICNAGTVVCQGTGGLVCSATSAIESETCDNQDDDCDGDTDEGLALDGSNLGALADAGCTVLGVCTATAPVAACSSGSYSCDYSGVTDYQGSETLCDGKDNDCDGQVDDVDPASDSTCDTDGECADFTATCNGDGGWSCVYNDSDFEDGGETGAHLCDGLDNDCDGQTDENCSAFGDACSSGESCPGGHCVGSICCDTACDSGCGSCHLSGTEGTCTPFDAGTDPDNDCGEKPWINEVNWVDTDPANYFIEVAGRVGTDTSGWSVAGVSVGGNLLSKQNLSASISDGGTGAEFGYNAIQMLVTNSFKNSHGAVLFDDNGNIIDYIIWETVTPGEGSALEPGVPLVIDILDDDGSNTSIRLSGTGAFASNFTWQNPAASSPGSLNDGQTMDPPGINVCDGAFACINSCLDGTQNTGDEAESDVDCGGQCGATCEVSEACDTDSDCVTGACIGSTCEDPP